MYTKMYNVYERVKKLDIKTYICDKYINKLFNKC